MNENKEEKKPKKVSEKELEDILKEPEGQKSTNERYDEDSELQGE